ncbi:hypothetical protein R0K05_25580, partial [Planococcus sp. SIMBA_160]
RSYIGVLTLADVIAAVLAAPWRRSVGKLIEAKPRTPAAQNGVKACDIADPETGHRHPHIAPERKGSAFHIRLGLAV